MFRLHKSEPKKLSIPHERRAAILPYRDWKILVVFFCVLFVAISTWHGYLLWQISHDKLIVSVAPVSKNEPKIDTVRISALLSVLSARASTTDVLRIKGVPFVDPSL